MSSVDVQKWVLKHAGQGMDSKAHIHFNNGHKLRPFFKQQVTTTTPVIEALEDKDSFSPPFPTFSGGHANVSNSDYPNHNRFDCGMDEINLILLT